MKKNKLLDGYVAEEIDSKVLQGLLHDIEENKIEIPKSKKEKLKEYVFNVSNMGETEQFVERLKDQGILNTDLEEIRFVDKKSNGMIQSYLRAGWEYVKYTDEVSELLQDFGARSDYIYATFNEMLLLKRDKEIGEMENEIERKKDQQYTQSFYRNHLLTQDSLKEGNININFNTERNGLTRRR